MSPCSEQGKLPAAKAFKLAERDKHMSEQKTVSFMEELDQWIQADIVQPLMYGDQPDDPDARSWEAIADQVRHGIRQKVLESYHNGLKAGAAKPARKEPRYAQAKTR